MSETVINKETELTPLQERAVYLFAGGKNVTDTAKELETDRATLYHWQKLPEFEAFYNKVRTELTEQTKNELLNLFSQALTTIKDCLKSSNENVKLKTAMYILEQQKEFVFGCTSKEKIISARAMDWGF